jgi:hypothetical protein
MRKDEKQDGIGFNADFIRSFATEKEMVDHYLQDHYLEYYWPGITKTARIKKLKELYKICTK